MGQYKKIILDGEEFWYRVWDEFLTCFYKREPIYKMVFYFDSLFSFGIRWVLKEGFKKYFEIFLDIEALTYSKEEIRSIINSTYLFTKNRKILSEMRKQEIANGEII